MILLANGKLITRDPSGTGYLPDGGVVTGGGKIVEVGEENHVTVIENRPLARGIYASTPLNGEIPAEFYGAVAEILVEVFRMNKKLV